MENILVSISCITYNHEKYIADAIDSFLMQVTNFNYEILIHDDASTDRTAEIIKEYEKKYPDIIKPIYQIENLYSKGISVIPFNINRAKGKYYALCEGDDFWTDPYKLQKQVDYMENHPECSLCVHGGYVVSASDKKVQYTNRPNKGNKIFNVDEIIAGGGGLFPTNSMFYPTDFARNRPSFLLNAPVGDYPLAINLSLLGTVFYNDELMSAYRVGDEDSWTARNLSTPEKEKKHIDEIANTLDEINQYTDYKYEETINWTKNYNRFYLLLKHRKFKEAKKGEFKDIYLELGFRRKIIVFFDQYFPNILKSLKSAKRQLIR
ncbi:glycosyltransferase family 2 protein [Rummeliibacillus sp. NPDC094406]|uniref:glycosyltransferase family 2 protein n=1 Tax=Rummeliibacillus sp. NPDC094406 TaxID=3364511 RepID=UPI00380FFF57